MSTNFEDLIVRDITANRPTAGIPGRLFYDTTLNKLQRDNGSTWDDCEPTSAANAFKTISVSGQSDVVADAAADTLTLVAGSGITITTNAGTDTITLAASGSATLEPWLVDILPTVSDPSATTGTWSVGYWTGEGQSGPWSTGEASGLQNTSNAQNDAVSWDVALSAGTWNATFWVRKSTNTGIITLNVDGSSAGTVDTYNGSVSYAKVSITGFTISTTGKHTLQVKMATKNGSSSGYVLGLLSVSFRRTA